MVIKQDTLERFYSYLNATIGSNLLAFIAGIKPANNPTAVQTTTAIPTHIQGTTKPVFNNIATMFPTSIPIIIPANAPIKLINTLSNKN